MITPDSIATLRGMAAAMTSFAPMSAVMLANLADDIEGNGPIARLIGDHPDADSPLYSLRALAGVRLLVLTGRAPELEDQLKQLTAHMREPAFTRRTWELFRETLLGNPEDILSAMDRPVQQHQPGRAGALLTGLGMLAAPKVRLLELGSCAGLNLLLDRYRWFGKDWEWGDRDSPVRLATTGRFPGDIEIVDRAGCDLAPRDPSDPMDAMILRSFLPHERDIDELELDDALALAAQSGVRVEKANAVEWLAHKLAQPAEDRSVYTVVWHSLFWSYLDSRDQTAIEKLLSNAAKDIRLAKVSYEPYRWATAPRLQVSVYS